jgi:hypothetical protein
MGPILKNNIIIYEELPAYRQAGKKRARQWVTKLG